MFRSTVLVPTALAIVLSSAAWAPSTRAEERDRPPNVVLMLADDLGYHDLSCYGHPKIETPQLDALARSGVRLTSFYAGATVCTPSRIALLTGAYPRRFGWTRGVVGYMIDTKSGLSPKAVTMAEVFRASGYRTGIVGKWHLGDRRPFLPHRQGFDLAYYINKSNNQTDELWRGDERLEKPFENRRLTEKFATEAIRFIRENASRPFLLYVPFSAPHFPVEAHPRWKGKSAFGVYGDVVEEMDARVGEILRTLEEMEIDRRTIVLFLSDNGPEPLTKESKADPFRGKKWSALEGGTRVPCIVRWTGVVPAGQSSDELIAAIDLLPTLVRACGIDRGALSGGPVGLDGVDVWDTLLGTQGAPHARRDLLYWHGADGLQAIRVGDWKLFIDGSRAGIQGRKSREPVLFRLSGDKTESKDVSAEYPDKVRAMRELAAEKLAGIEEGSIELGRVDGR